MPWRRSGRRCSTVLARRLDLPLPDFRLATVADFWSVPFERQHDALCDARVVAKILPHMLALAVEQDVELPIATGGRVPVLRSARAPRARCAFLNPGQLTAAGLVQGMRVALTGETGTPRATLERLLSEAGLAVADAVSRRTSVLVANDSAAGSGKAKAAADQGRRRPRHPGDRRGDPPPPARRCHGGNAPRYRWGWHRFAGSCGLGHPEAPRPQSLAHSSAERSSPRCTAATDCGGSVRWGRATTTDWLRWRAPTGSTPRTTPRTETGGAEPSERPVARQQPARPVRSSWQSDGRVPAMPSSRRGR